MVCRRKRFPCFELDSDAWKLKIGFGTKFPNAATAMTDLRWSRPPPCRCCAGWSWSRTADCRTPCCTSAATQPGIGPNISCNTTRHRMHGPNISCNTTRHRRHGPNISCNTTRHRRHGPNIYKEDTKPKKSSLLMFNRVNRLEIPSVMLVFSAPLVN